MKCKVWLFGGLILLGMAIAIALIKIRADWFKPDYLSIVLSLRSFPLAESLSPRCRK